MVISYWIPRYLVHKDHAARDLLHLGDVLFHIFENLVLGDIAARAANDVSARLFVITTVKGLVRYLSTQRIVGGFEQRAHNTQARDSRNLESNPVQWALTSSPL